MRHRLGIIGVVGFNFICIISSQKYKCTIQFFNFESSWVSTFRKKLYAKTFEENNPIADAVTTQCPHLAKQLNNPYEGRLGGDEILKINGADCTKMCRSEATNYVKKLSGDLLTLVIRQ